eukprot:GHVL01009720.1.p3 GENE.GHVL01009720.1~~GHVL01009720.1.p3  ORF type:complete len:101 (-),score=20.17 GHVL01009720.1:260-562(-)
MDVLRDALALLGAAERLPVLPVLHAVDKASSAERQQQHQDEGEAGTAGDAASLPLASLLRGHVAPDTAVPGHRHDDGGGCAVRLLWQGVMREVVVAIGER